MSESSHHPTKFANEGFSISKKQLLKKTPGRYEWPAYLFDGHPRYWPIWQITSAKKSKSIFSYFSPGSADFNQSSFSSCSTKQSSVRSRSLYGFLYVLPSDNTSVRAAR